MDLEQLKIQEEILAGSYWENFKYEKDMAQCLGGSHPKIQRLHKACNKMAEEWHKVSEQIKKLENV